MFAKDYRFKARQRLTGNWWLSVAVCFVAALLGGGLVGSSIATTITQRLSSNENWKVFLPMLSLVIAGGSVIAIAQFILGGPVRLGLCRYLLNQQEGKPLAFRELFSQFHRLGDGLCLMLLTNIFVILWSLLLIIPGIVAGYRYAMAPFLMVEDPNCAATEAIRRSKGMMYGHKWELFCLDLSFIGWMLLSALTLSIGDLFLVPYRSAAYAAFYRNLRYNGAAQ